MRILLKGHLQLLLLRIVTVLLLVLSAGVACYTTYGYSAFSAQYVRISHGDRNLYVLQHDVIVSESVLKRHHRALRFKELMRKVGWIEIGPALKELKTPRRKDSTWDHLPVSFTIDPSGFTDAEFSEIEELFCGAAEDWEAICGVRFVYTTFRSDESPDVDFVVVAGSAAEEDAARFVATSFLGPKSDDRRIRVFRSFFDTTFDKRGVFRHEIGHSLGFAHEHNDIFAPSDCARDDPVPASHNLTPYDRRSVMHYVCGTDGGSREFAFTDKDIRGAQDKYPPAE